MDVTDVLRDRRHEPDGLGSMAAVSAALSVAPPLSAEALSPGVSAVFRTACFFTTLACFTAGFVGALPPAVASEASSVALAGTSMAVDGGSDRALL